MGLAIGPDGRLYVANWTGGVSAWSLDEPSVGKPLREWSGPEVKGPLGLAFTTGPRGPEVKFAGGLGTQMSPEKLAFFESRVRPLLHAKCIDCHGESLQEGGLRLDTRAGWERGGRSGARWFPATGGESSREGRPVRRQGPAHATGRAVVSSGGGSAGRVDPPGSDRPAGGG